MTTPTTDQAVETVQNTEDATETEQVKGQAPATEQDSQQDSDPAEDLAKVTAERDALAGERQAPGADMTATLTGTSTLSAEGAGRG